MLRTYRVDCPVIVVGNISVGGTGKTPFVMWLAELLQSRGQRVGIVTRGYGGQSTHWPREVTADSSTIGGWRRAGHAGAAYGCDRRCGPGSCAGSAARDRTRAQIVLSDDGLQHYRLQTRRRDRSRGRCARSGQRLAAARGAVARDRVAIARRGPGRDDAATWREEGARVRCDSRCDRATATGRSRRLAWGAASSCWSASAIVLCMRSRRSAIRRHFSRRSLSSD